MQRNRQAGFNTRAIHEGYDPMEEQGALIQPIYMTSTYAFESAESAARIMAGEEPGYVYGRTKNPTQALLETRLASLEGAEAAVATGSGMGAISSLFWSLLRPGDELLAHHTLYGNSYALISQALPEFGIKVKLVDMTDLSKVGDALSPSVKMLYCETPANPNLDLIDLQGLAALAKTVGALSVVDNTFCSPATQRPLELGIDMTIHSMTKFLGGHGDLLAGALVGPQEVINKVRMTGLRYLTGATIAPLTAYLVMRGIKTLGLRMERHSTNAQALAELLADHPKVAAVRYPGLASHPGHEIAKRQMSRFGGLLAFELKGGKAAGQKLMDSLQLATRAVSLGDCETLIQHPASMTHAQYSRQELLDAGMSEGLIRLSTGLEDIEDILEDFEQALDLI